MEIIKIPVSGQRYYNKKQDGGIGKCIGIFIELESAFAEMIPCFGSDNS